MSTPLAPEFARQNLPDRVRFDKCPKKRTRAVCAVLIALLTGGCVSQPPSTKENADALSVMGVMLMMSAAQQKGSATSSLLQVKIPPRALEVILAVQQYQASNGKWPSKEEVRLPAGITEVEVTVVDLDLDLGLRAESATLLCRLSPDGTVLIMPSFEKLIGALQKLRLR